MPDIERTYVKQADGTNTRPFAMPASERMSDGSPRSGLSQTVVSEIVRERAEALAEVTRLRNDLEHAWDRGKATADAEVERLKKRLDFTQEWYSTRWQRIADELRDTDAWPRVACIMANGTAEATEPPTYAQQMNLLKHEVERLREALIEAHTYLGRGEYIRALDHLDAALDKDRYGAED